MSRHNWRGLGKPRWSKLKSRVEALFAPGAPPVAGIGALGAGGARGVGVAPRGGDLGMVEARQVDDGRIRRVRRC